MSDMSLRQIVADAWDAALDREQSVEISHVVDTVIASHPDLIRAHGDELARGALGRYVRELARREAQDEGEAGGQLALGGFPAVIAIPGGGPNGHRYMRATKATWPDLAAGRAIRAKNVERAQARLDAYDESLADFRPFMEGTNKTLADALRETQGADVTRAAAD